VVTPPFRVGKYEVVEQLGEGGMGTVYRAYDTVLERMVALKTLHAAGGFEETSRRRFLREARSVARLQHPNIITVFDFGEVEERPFIAMELLAGTPLDEAVEDGRVTSLAGKLRIVEQLCRGLGYAHSQGVIHRDVKPSNVFLLEDETVKLLDFGIAFLEGGTVTTDRGTVLGTPNYMAPEQFKSEGVDHRVDVWSVGVILYELLTGARPFVGKSVPSMIFQIIHSPPKPSTPRAQAPPALVECLNRAAEPDQRFGDMESTARPGDVLRQLDVIPAAAGHQEVRWPTSCSTAPCLTRRWPRCPAPSLAGSTRPA
jgi:serine/threonine-protein kinase